MRTVVAPPATEGELSERANALAGRSLAWVADQRGIEVPANLKRDKGWIGQLLESVLGATAGSRAQPDFPGLGIEMKTLPVSPLGAPRQSTYVCTAPLNSSVGTVWKESWVCRKLARVLWIPIVGNSDTPVGERIVGGPLFWSPDAEEAAALQTDWEELTELIERGEVWQIDAKRGQYLQLRPKGANSEALVWTLDEEGEWVRDMPRGFYLRARFTAQMLKKHFLLG